MSKSTTILIPSPIGPLILQVCADNKGILVLLPVRAGHGMGRVVVVVVVVVLQ